jgi:hypothetical protein
VRAYLWFSFWCHCGITQQLFRRLMKCSTKFHYWHSASILLVDLR